MKCVDKCFKIRNPFRIKNNNIAFKLFKHDKRHFNEPKSSIRPMSFQVSLTEISVDYLWLGSTKKNDETGFSEFLYLDTYIYSVLGKNYVN